MSAEDIVSVLSEKKWTTAEGVRIPYCKVTHQHWSNIYWYHKVFLDIPGMSPHVMEKICVEAELQLYNRYGGKILPWKPTYEYELNWLNHLGFVIKKEDRVIVKDKWGHEIGEVIGDLKYVPGVQYF